ncbi:unnamed protein product [Darwinula stevensoni]|uniref:Uncharacterized protein n=1 Tax=Darwinula stevensoni TaxID=69355 RepID=A0A7R8XBW1_9CRUS|nr:unnamed protein product [Darwinula stevensoni]CAG0891390.1 unnamed protein product [Darwinula stevensoni]
MDEIRELHGRLKEGIREILTEGVEDVGAQLEALRAEIAMRKGGQPPLRFPRSFDKSLVRYELPMDPTLLADVNPMTYLTQYGSVEPCLRSLHSTVYKRHRELQSPSRLSLKVSRKEG